MRGVSELTASGTSRAATKRRKEASRAGLPRWGAAMLRPYNGCRKRSQQRQLAVECRRRQSKMEIPG